MMVVSRLDSDYCNSLYNGLPMISIKKLQLAQNFAARIIDRTPRRAHMTPRVGFSLDTALQFAGFSQDF